MATNLNLYDSDERKKKVEKIIRDRMTYEVFEEIVKSKIENYEISDDSPHAFTFSSDFNLKFRILESVEENITELEEMFSDLQSNAYDNKFLHFDAKLVELLRELDGLDYLKDETLRLKRRNNYEALEKLSEKLKNLAFKDLESLYSKVSKKISMNNQLDLQCSVIQHIESFLRSNEGTTIREIDDFRYELYEILKSLNNLI
jgi:hypothetical protein